MLADFHIHTHFSFDSEAAVPDIVNKAVRLGMSQICITDHEDMDYDETHSTELDLDEYYNYLLDQQNLFRSALELYIGVELGLVPEQAERLDTFVEQYPLDFVIGSTHVVDGLDPYYPKFWEDRSPQQAIEAYFSSVMQCLRNCSNFDVYGHLDYVTRYCKDPSFHFRYTDYSDQIDEILNILIFTGKGIELNTGGLYKGSNTTNPGADILKRYRELGGEIITLGSDAHKAKLVGYGFDQARELLLQCGFDYYTIYKQRHARYIKL